VKRLVAADPELARVLTADVADGRTTALIEAARRGHLKVWMGGFGGMDGWME
jgi:hypothetical protein